VHACKCLLLLYASFRAFVCTLTFQVLLSLHVCFSALIADILSVRCFFPAFFSCFCCLLCASACSCLSIFFLACPCSQHFVAFLLASLCCICCVSFSFSGMSCGTLSCATLGKGKSIFWHDLLRDYVRFRGIAHVHSFSHCPFAHTSAMARHASQTFPVIHFCSCQIPLPLCSVAFISPSWSPAVDYTSSQNVTLFSRPAEFC
jgi:hypothetical protein